MQVRRRNEHSPNRVMCTAKPSWRSMTLAEMVYKKYMVNINVRLDGMIAIDSKTRVSNCVRIIGHGHTARLLNAVV